MQRIALTKKQRFNVFKRDSFCCQYCGSTPPSVVLEVDHIYPVSLGGKNSIENLITACFDCNRGKGAGLLTTLPDSITSKSELMAEKIEQLKAFERLIKAKKKIEERGINEVESAFQIYFSNLLFSNKFRESIRVFLQKLPSNIVVESMHRACSKIDDKDNALKYFCGICWGIIKAKKNG